MQSAAIYVRVSTDDQTEYSPEAQKRALFDYAARNDIYISPEHIYADEGISGRRADKRPQFQKMISTAKTKPRPFDIILVHKFDRFARSREDSIVYKSMLLRECGVKVISITEDLSDDKTSVILEAMLEAMGEYYSLNLSEEVKKGMTIKAERGEMQTTPPLGYTMDKENKKLVINETEAEIVRFIFREFLYLTPIMQICKKLNRMGMKTKRGNMFVRERVEYILCNPIYIGKVRWTPTGRTNFNFNNPDTLIVQSNHEPIISESDFKAAHDIWASRKKIYKQPHTYRKYFLSGFVKCSACGANLTTHGRGALQCGNYVHGKCAVSHFLKIQKLEDILKELLEYDSKFGNKKSDFNIKSSNQIKLNYNIDAQIKKINKKLERATDAYINGIYDLEYLKKLKSEIEKEMTELEKQKEVMNTHEKLDISEIAKSALNIFNKKLSVDERRHIAESTIERITYMKSENTIILDYKL